VSPSLLWRLILAGYGALLLLLLIWHGWLFPSRYFSITQVLLVTALPLALPLPGLLRRRARGSLWVALLMLLYFMHGIVEALANPPQRLPALVEIGLSLGICIAAALHARSRFREEQG
jgi:uncharacterized membrane protein